MEAFLCKQCPLAFEIGGFVHWDLTGSTDQMVCTACGVMHRLVFHKARGYHDMQTGTSELFALPRPIRQLDKAKHDNGFGQEIEDYKWSYTEDEWIKVAEFENRPALDSLSCHHCHTAGKLASREKPENEFGKWPVFCDKNGELHCPLCDGPIESLYWSIIN